MKKKGRDFSSFDMAGACKELQITNLLEWGPVTQPFPPSDFFYEHLRRLESIFDLRSSDRAKELLVDAICEEALHHHPTLKMWKAAIVRSKELSGTIDYVAAPNRGYLDDPLLCVVVARKDDFEQGLSQCLIAMKACQQCNERAGNQIEIYSAATNGEGWKFYKLTREGQVYESPFYVISNIQVLLGYLHYVLTQCADAISSFASSKTGLRNSGEFRH